MRRRLIQLGLFLLLGTIVNVAVAWGISMWACGGLLKQPWETTDEEAVAIYHRHIPREPACNPDPLHIWAEDWERWSLRQVTISNNHGDFCDCAERFDIVRQ